MKASDIVKAYTIGAIDIAEANRQLEAIGAGYYFSNTANVITAEEKAATICEPGNVNGWAMLNTGIGSLNKVEVIDGKLKYEIGFDGYVYMCGKEFVVRDGKTLEELMA